MDIKVPVVSVVLASPLHSASLRKGSWNIQVPSVPGDAIANLETISHPKMPNYFVDDLSIIDVLALCSLKMFENTISLSQYRWTSKVPVYQ
jgi:hypothetical protein